MATAYVRPLGWLEGASAQQACADGWALALGDGGRAFTACELLWRDDTAIERRILPAARLDDLPAGAPEPVRPSLRTRLLRLTQAQDWPRELPAPPVIMGVVNVTPDSFSDGGCFFETSRAIAHGRRLWQEGAAIIDVGGESTRPGALELPVEQELQRVVPVVETLAADGILVSIDTRKAAVMEAAAAAGARMINDITALRHDPEALDTAAALGLPVVLMHSRGEPASMQRDPRYRDAPLDVFDHLEQRVETCLAAGLQRQHLIVDPGIGFGKTLQHNLDILHHLALYRCLGLPIALGVSRKSFIGRIDRDAPAIARLPGSLAAGLAAIINGVSLLRVHDVDATRQALALWRVISL